MLQSISNWQQTGQRGIYSIPARSLISLPFAYMCVCQHVLTRLEMVRLWHPVGNGCAAVHTRPRTKETHADADTRTRLSMNSFVFTSSLSFSPGCPCGIMWPMCSLWRKARRVTSPVSHSFTADRQHIAPDTELLYGQPVVEEYNTHNSRFEIHWECGRTWLWAIDSADLVSSRPLSATFTEATFTKIKQKGAVVFIQKQPANLRFVVQDSPLSLWSTSLPKKSAAKSKTSLGCSRRTARVSRSIKASKLAGTLTELTSSDCDMAARLVNVCQGEPFTPKVYRAIANSFPQEMFTLRPLPWQPEPST